MCFCVNVYVESNYGFGASKYFLLFLFNFISRDQLHLFSFLFFLNGISVSLVVTDVCRPRRFPPWCGRAALWGSWAGIALANVVSIWAGHGFAQKVAMMWLISCFASVMCSCLLLEPMKVESAIRFIYFEVFI